MQRDTSPKVVKENSFIQNPHQNDPDDAKTFQEPENKRGKKKKTKKREKTWISNQPAISISTSQQCINNRALFHDLALCLVAKKIKKAQIFILFLPKKKYFPNPNNHLTNQNTA